jgi:hypothetical protein
VQKRRPSVKLPFCVHRHPKLPLTKAELCGMLAAELGPSAAEVERLLAKLAEIARADLANDGPGMFRLGRIGRIGDASRNGRQARNRDSLVERLTATLVELEDVTDEMPDEDKLAVEERNEKELATRRAEAAAFCRVLFRLAAEELGKEDVAEFRLPGVGTIKAKKRGGYGFRPYGALQAPAARLA